LPFYASGPPVADRENQLKKLQAVGLTTLDHAIAAVRHTIEPVTKLDR
jgi:hypothetical protein